VKIEKRDQEGITGFLNSQSKVLSSYWVIIKIYIEIFSTYSNQPGNVFFISFVRARPVNPDFIISLNETSFLPDF
jgi:hypothetical protein